MGYLKIVTFVHKNRKTHARNMFGFVKPLLSMGGYIILM